jgi:hypothetical protein
MKEKGPRGPKSPWEGFRVIRGGLGSGVPHDYPVPISDTERFDFVAYAAAQGGADEAGPEDDIMRKAAQQRANDILGATLDMDLDLKSVESFKNRLLVETKHTRRYAYQLLALSPSFIEQHPVEVRAIAVAYLSLIGGTK